MLARDPPPRHSGHVLYERLVADLATEVGRVCDLLGVDFGPGMVDYGGPTQAWGGLGDPFTANRELAPNPRYERRWLDDIEQDERRLARACEALDGSKRRISPRRVVGAARSRRGCAIARQRIAGPVTPSRHRARCRGRCS